jgi:hypothetical protein
MERYCVALWKPTRKPIIIIKHHRSILLERYYIITPKPTRKPIPSLKYFIIKHHGCTLLDGYCSLPKLLNTLIIPFSGYPKNTLGSITYLLKLRGVFHNPIKTYKQSNTMLRVSYKCFGLYNIFFETWKGITLPYQNVRGK